MTSRRRRGHTVKLVIQRVSEAKVRIGDRVVGAIGCGLLVLVGIEKGDGREEIVRAARRVATLRVFEDDQGKMNRGLDEVGGAVLAVSQFTLAASIRRGRRPAFDHAMKGDEAITLFDVFVDELRAEGLQVETGEFGAYMDVELINSGPVTLLWDEQGHGQERVKFG
jgi:D-tyrosyl-tRNA(Tyr) deacylase